jgi:hypothetical protein
MRETVRDWRVLIPLCGLAFVLGMASPVRISVNVGAENMSENRRDTIPAYTTSFTENEARFANSSPVYVKPIAANVKVCVFSKKRARPRCPVTESLGVNAVAPEGLCEFHARVCPVDGATQSLIDPNTNEERLFCAEHGAKLVPIGEE